MAEEFLEEIYKEAKLFCAVKQLAEFAKMHDTGHEVQMGNQRLPELGDLCQKYMEQDSQKALELWRYIESIMEIKDPILIGDILEHNILPLLSGRMGQWGNICVENEEGDYLFESALSGFLTIKDLQRNRYFHSTVDPMWEAQKMAEYIYDPRKKKYSFRGCGLGYLIYQLYEISDGTVFIQLFERDGRMVEYARKYGVLGWVPEQNLEIVIDADPSSFLQSTLEEDTGVHIFAPERYGEPEDMQAVMEEVYIQYGSQRKHRKDAEINYWNNLRSGSKMISEFDASELKKDFIIIAGGPSLDDNMEFLRENMGKKTLIAVGTVFRKLIQADIIPDMVVVLDSNPRTYRQLEGMEKQTVPLLLSMTAYWKFAGSYQGEKYLIPLKNMEQEIGYALKEYEASWEGGGTVTFLGMEAAIRFGAEQIYLVGADMSYPNGFSHASGTIDRTMKGSENLIPVEGVGGTTVYTDRVLYCYRKQIEEKIAEEHQIKYYNMSRVGARIAGTIEID